MPPAATGWSSISRRPTCRPNGALMADAAVEGRIVYQVKQLYESLTGRGRYRPVENSFGSLVPARGHFHLKALFDPRPRWSRC